MQETWVWSLGWKDVLEKGMATHSNILAWKIPWKEESGRLQSMESRRIGHSWNNLACPSRACPRPAPCTPGNPLPPRETKLALPSPLWETHFYLLVGLIPLMQNALFYFYLFKKFILVSMGFPDSSVGKESACNAGDLGWTGLGTIPWRKGRATHYTILAWRIP